MGGASARCGGFLTVTRDSLATVPAPAAQNSISGTGKEGDEAAPNHNRLRIIQIQFDLVLDPKQCPLYGFITYLITNPVGGPGNANPTENIALLISNWDTNSVETTDMFFLI